MSSIVYTRITQTFTAMFVVAIMATPAFAQTSIQAPIHAVPDVWEDHILEQVQQSLLDESDEVRVATMQVLLDLHKAYPEQDWNATVPHLIANYKWMDLPAERMMALAALNAIGGDEAMTRLADAVTNEAEPTVRRATLASLAWHRTQQN